MISVDQVPVVRMEDRLGFRYVEKASVYVKDNTIVMSRKNGRKEHLCPFSVVCVLLGAGNRRLWLIFTKAPLYIGIETRILHRIASVEVKAPLYIGIEKARRSPRRSRR